MTEDSSSEAILNQLCIDAPSVSFQNTETTAYTVGQELATFRD